VLPLDAKFVLDWGVNQETFDQQHLGFTRNAKSALDCEVIQGSDQQRTSELPPMQIWIGLGVKIEDDPYLTISYSLLFGAYHCLAYHLDMDVTMRMIK